MPEAWFNLYEMFEYVIKDGKGNLPTIKEKKELPNIYSLIEEKENE